MSTLQVMLGEAQGELKTQDGRVFKLFPLKLSDLAKLQAKLGPTSQWDSAQTREKLKRELMDALERDAEPTMESE